MYELKITKMPRTGDDSMVVVECGDYHSPPAKNDDYSKYKLLRRAVRDLLYRDFGDDYQVKEREHWPELFEDMLKSGAKMP